MPVALRLALVPWFPVPVPAGADDFGHLLLGDTVAHFRFANPVHPMHRFFEAVFVLQQPSYSSIYPAGQGIVLALGQLIFGHPWAGVLISAGLFCGLCYWMLRAWVTPEWALLGGLLAVAEFGPLCEWMNDYWGGAVSAAAACLVFGALPRLRSRPASAWLLGLGFAVQFISRPAESLLLAIAAGLYLAVRRPPAKLLIPVLLGVLPGVAATLVQDRQVTGSWTMLPYQLSRFEYGVPAAFTFQPNPVPHRALTREQQLDYAAQCAIHDTAGTFAQRLWERMRFYRFFFLAPLWLALPAFLWKLREFRFAWVLGTVVLFAAGTNFYPYFYPHYIAAETCLFVLISVVALERLPRTAARLILLLCGAHFLFWYGARAVVVEPDPDGRLAVNQSLAKAPGAQLVFVRYAPAHRFHEWIHNAADIDASRVVWAADLGDAEDAALLRYYPQRTAWLVEPDARPVRLTPYNGSVKHE